MTSEIIISLFGKTPSPVHAHMTNSSVVIAVHVHTTIYSTIQCSYNIYRHILLEVTHVNHAIISVIRLPSFIN